MSEARTLFVNASRLLTWLLLLFCAGLHAQSETITYFYTDQLGSVLATADSQGNVVSTSDYRPYGDHASGSPATGPGFTGHVEDGGVGLVYMQARYYDPQIGRFLSPDPVRPDGTNVFENNRFAYVNNNPVRYNDPSGRCIWDACVAETYVAGVIIAAGAAYATHLIVAQMRDHPVAGPISPVHNEAQPGTTSDDAKGKVFDGTSPAAGDSGAKGEREGVPGGETAAWEKIAGKETQYPNGTKVKELADGGHADLHSSTKSKDYPQGTPSIKIRDGGNNVIGTVRYPQPPPPPEIPPTNSP